MAGLEQIKIPIKANQCTIQNIMPYLKTVYSIFQANKKQIRQDYDLFCIEHDIKRKTRQHAGDQNHIVLSPHVRSMVLWKTGYTLGNPIKYAQCKTSQTDDITTLNTYIRNSNKMSVDKQVAEWAYSTGVGYYFIQPKTVEFDVSHEAPFEIFCVDADSCGKVYSSYLGNAPLFDFLYTEIEDIDENGNKKRKRIFSIYMPNEFYEFETTNGTTFKQINYMQRLIYKYLPLVEMQYHNRIGISCAARSLQEAVDQMSSDTVDSINDIVNQIWVFINATLGKNPEEKTANLQLMKKLGAIELISISPDMQAKLDKITTTLNAGDVMSARAILLREMYDTNGVPIPSTSMSSGNVTKGGGEVTNGYESAYNRALDDKNAFMPAQMQVLERIISICHATSGCKLDQLFASEIEIKYCFNNTENILTKSQSYMNLIETGMPPQMALEKTRLSNDSEAEGAMIERNLEIQFQRQATTEVGGAIDEQQ